MQAVVCCLFSPPPQHTHHWVESVSLSSWSCSNPPNKSVRVCWLEMDIYLWCSHKSLSLLLVVRHSIRLIFKLYSTILHTQHTIDFAWIALRANLLCLCTDDDISQLGFVSTNNTTRRMVITVRRRQGKETETQFPLSSASLSARWRDICCRVECRERKEFIILYSTLSWLCRVSINLRLSLTWGRTSTTTTDDGSRGSTGNEMKSNPARCLRCLALLIYLLSRFGSVSFVHFLFAPRLSDFHLSLFSCRVSDFYEIEKTFLLAFFLSRRWA